MVCLEIGGELSLALDVLHDGLDHLQRGSLPSDVCCVQLQETRTHSILLMSADSFYLTWPSMMTQNTKYSLTRILWCAIYDVVVGMCGCFISCDQLNSKQHQIVQPIFWLSMRGNLAQPNFSVTLPLDR